MVHKISIKYEDIISIDNLYNAYKSAVKSKGLKKRIAQFQSNLSIELYRLYQQLIDGSYQPQPCNHFEIWCTAGQKVRQIAAPAIRDCVVQHLLYQQVCPLFEKFLIKESYGCRKYKGTHRAFKHIRHHLNSYTNERYYLQIDVRKYYYNISHSILKKTIERYVKDQRIVDLMMLFCQSSTEIGLDVGCLLSQFYGLLFLNMFDHFCKRHLHVKTYARYVDDIVIVGLTKSQAYQYLKTLSTFLKTNLGLSLSKFRVNKLKTGINFVGYRMWYTKTLVRKRTLKTFKRSITNNKYTSLNGLCAHSLHTTTYQHFISNIKHTMPITEYTHLPLYVRQDLAK